MALSTGKRMCPAQAGEPGEIVVQRHPHGVVLDGEGRVLGVGDQVAAGVAVPAQPIDDVPMTRSGCHPDRVIGTSSIGCAGTATPAATWSPTPSTRPSPSSTTPCG